MPPLFCFYDSDNQKAVSNAFQMSINQFLIDNKIRMYVSLMEFFIGRFLWYLSREIMKLDSPSSGLWGGSRLCLYKLKQLRQLYNFKHVQIFQWYIRDLRILSRRKKWNDVFKSWLPRGSLFRQKLFPKYIDMRKIHLFCY